MPQPAHASLLQQCVHAGDSISLQDAVVCDFVLPGDVLFLSGSKGSGLAAVEEGVEDAGSVDLDFGALSQLAVDPYSLC